MSVARGFPNAGHYYNNIVKPVALNVQFTVTATNGLGVTSVKSNGYVRNVFMHTSTTPAVGNDGVTNPNPLAGFAIVQLKQNFNTYLGALASIISPVTGSIKIDNSALTAGQAYVISTLGNATAAKWLAIGVPPGVTPAVGVSFIALTDGGAGNTLTSRVSTPSVSGISSIEVVGSPTLSVASSIGTNGGEYLLLQFLAPGGSGSITAPTLTMNSYTPAGAISRGNIPVATGTAGQAVTNNAGTLNSSGGEDLTVDLQTLTGTPAVLTGTISAPVFSGSLLLAPANPVDSSIVNMTFFFDQSSVTVDGL